MAEELKMVTSRDGIATVTMCNGENRFRMSFVKAWMKILDEIDRNETIKGLVITGTNKFFSLGLDITFISAQTPQYFDELRLMIGKFIVRLTHLPIPTVAALNGHCFGAGAFLALSCDYRVMRSDRGWLCWPEVALNMRISQPNISLIRMKFPSDKSVRDAVLFGKRLSARDSCDLQLVDVVSTNDSLNIDATKLVQEALGKNGIDRKSLKQMKEDIYVFPELLFVQNEAKL